MKPVAMTPRILAIYNGKGCDPISSPGELKGFVDALADPDTPSIEHTSHDLQVLRWAHAEWVRTSRKPRID